MDYTTRLEQAENKMVKQERSPALSAQDINHILVNGAKISSSKLRRATSEDSRLFYFAEIGVYLEVSLSQGSGITDQTRKVLADIHQQALIMLMDASINSDQ